ncbi:nucleoside-diphosphate-sugar epimerase family protein [Exidia glandulosa HHB12029]|uniref:Nucleoside-diphosphate-sugar epimerase family protein n=1 Tax=Exidia glandulosa HHB12029 TaxID=1314781 RepID=A0A165KEZ9_EXIGL|nr:nucleoside-diphosphate-sugar epimerase family protein [Exidia glandulosa HHB12029]
MSLQRILVTGATGKQGGATVRALVRANEASTSGPRFEILAVTRNPEGAAAKKLASLSNVKLVKGDLEDVPAIFKAAGSDIYGVYSVQVAMGGGANVVSEERQGKALADEAEKAGVKHFVYSSVDFGNIEGTTGIPHFDSKRRVEEHIKAKNGLKWTILRPVAFMDGFFDPQFATVFATLIKTKIRPNVKLQLIDSTDIGEFAVIAFANPEEYIGKTISIAGDELTYSEMSKAFEDVLGHPPKTTFSLVGTVINLMVKELRTMFAFFDKTGYKADVSRCKEIYPGLHSFRQYLETKKGESQ